MKRKRVISWSCTLVILIGVSIWCKSRWKAWFHNPEETVYVPADSPDRICLTFGNDGELSRFVSWMCGTTVDTNAYLLLAVEGDTIQIPAVGDTFQSRAGVAAYYRAEMKQLKPNKSYSYAVMSQNVLSSWFHFHTSNPDSLSFSFLYFGDVQDTLNGVANSLIKKALYNHPEAEFIVFGGDLIERPMDVYFGETFRSIDSACTAMPILNVTGNHDYLKYLIRKCERRFALTFPYFLKGQEERGDNNHLFSFRYHNTDFILLDSEREFFYLFGQKRWLKNTLEQSSGTHKIVILHHPLYSVKKKNNNLIQRWMFNGLIQDAAVDLVLQGHEHGYTHNVASEEPLLDSICNNRPLYTVSHCSPKTYRLKPTKRFSPVLSGSRYYQLVQVNGDHITMRAYDAVTDQQVDCVYIY